MNKSAAQSVNHHLPAFLTGSAVFGVAHAELQIGWSLSRQLLLSSCFTREEQTVLPGNKSIFLLMTGKVIPAFLAELPCVLERLHSSGCILSFVMKHGR